MRRRDNGNVPLYVDNADDPTWLVRFGEGMRAVCNRDHVVAATCPFCLGGPSTSAATLRDDRIRLVEAIEVYRPVVVRDGYNAVGDDGYHTGEGYDDGIPGTLRFECHHQPPDADGQPRWCGARWAVPAWWMQAVDWDSIGRPDMLES